MYIRRRLHGSSSIQRASLHRITIFVVMVKQRAADARATKQKEWHEKLKKLADNATKVAAKNLQVSLGKELPIESPLVCEFEANSAVSSSRTSASFVWKLTGSPGCHRIKSYPHIMYDKVGLRFTPRVRPAAFAVMFVCLFVCMLCRGAHIRQT